MSQEHMHLVVDRLTPAIGAFVRRTCAGIGLAAVLAPPAMAQTTMTWPDVRARFEAGNPTLQADQFSVEESQATEITAFLRPNPQCGLTLDQIGNTVSTPDTSANLFSAATVVGNCSYLHERQHKRELRRDSAHAATTVAASTHVNLDRTLTFTLRSAFVQVLAGKAALTLARDNLTFYDQVLAISQQRFQAGDIAQIDLNRLQLQRVQFESAIESAIVSLRTAKIQLLALLNDPTPPDQFDVSGPFDFAEIVPALDQLHGQALDNRPDLHAAVQGIDQARINHNLAMANGSTDPTFTIDAGVPSISQAWQSYAPRLDRADDLFKIGAIAKKDLEVARDAEAKATVDVRTTRERLRVLGVDADQPPASVVDMVAPVSGVITDQQVTNAAGVQSLGTNPFTISDLSSVWVVCDVYENDLAGLRVGDTAEIHLAAYPDLTLKGRIGNILPMLDPTIRTAKVRIEVQNAGQLRLGMFVTATFRGQQLHDLAVVPATAIIHLHDRDFVYVPGQAAGQFRRVEVVAGQMRPGNQQEIRSGLEPGARVVNDGLAFVNSVDQ